MTMLSLGGLLEWSAKSALSVAVVIGVLLELAGGAFLLCCILDRAADRLARSFHLHAEIVAFFRQRARDRAGKRRKR